MHVRKALAGLVAAVFLILGAAGCASASGRMADGGKSGTPSTSDVRIHEIVYNERLYHLMGHDDAKSFASSSEDTNDPKSKEGYLSIKVNGDKTVSVFYSGQQLRYRRNYLKKHISMEVDAFPTYYQGSSVTVSQDHRHIRVSLTRDVAFSPKMSRAGTAIIVLESYCAEQQIYAHPGDPSWTCDITIVNADTGKTVITGDAVDGINFNKTTWKSSE